MATARIVIPCYNEEKRFQSARFIAFKSLSHTIKFLFVDDGSTDETLRLLKNLNTVNPGKFQVLHLFHNCGKAEAVRQGVLAALASHPNYIGYWDADLATPLEAIDDLIEIAETWPELQLIMGSRVKLLGRNVERSRMRHYLGRVFATAVSIVLEIAVYDTQCGAKLFRICPATKSLFQQPFVSRWIFDVEILARLLLAMRQQDCMQPKQAIYEFPLREWRDIPGSKVRPSDFIRAPWELLRIRQCYFSYSRSTR
jgi:glycosyltransferase involved in cell wall biosynthesis